MKVVSVNIGKPTIVKKGKKEVKTGVYKTTIEGSITLGINGVVGDAVMDKKHHGGIDKACYLYATNHYNFWKKQFPALNWSWGMFGENISVENLDESKIFIGDTFKIGSAIIQVSEPRRPCSILGIRFGTQKMVKLFNNIGFSGTYVRIIQEGEVKKDDEIKLIEQSSNLSVSDIFNLFSINKSNLALAKKAINCKALSEKCKTAIKEKYSL